MFDQSQMQDAKSRDVVALQKELESLRQQKDKKLEGLKAALMERDTLIAKFKRQGCTVKRGEQTDILGEQVPQDDVKVLEEQIKRLQNRVVFEADRRDRFELQTLELKDRLNEKKRLLDASQREVKALRETIRHMAQDKTPATCDNFESCEGAVKGLCGRCIAYIGGQNKQAKFFKNYVEGQNGKFLHHDGGLHDGQARLDAILEKADAVMFPVSCISHEAATKIKQLCLRHKKPFVPLRTQGLAAFTRGLDSLNGEYFTRN